MVLLIGIREMSIDRGWSDRSGPQLALLGHRFAGVGQAAEQVTVGCVREPGRVRRVRRVPRAKIRIVTGHHDDTVLLGHRGDRVRVVRERQMFHRVQVSREDQRLPVTARRRDKTSAAVPNRELMATATAPTDIER